MRLGNRYLLLSRIATGGMGEVWRARDELLGREVAVKVLRSHIYADHTFRDRFRNEARITAAVSDPGIAQIFDYGEQSGLAYLVMELIHGEPLSAILARNGSLGPEVALDVLHQTAKALHAAHAAAVIHRDVKPGNLLVTPEGLIKVTDFGIARALEAAPVTQTGTVLGTAQYVSPEQAQGLPLTPATDLYSLGVVAYECLSGHTPFRAEGHVAIALQHLNELPPSLGADVPAPVRELVMTLLAKDPAQRPGSALELADRAYVLRESLAVTSSQGSDSHGSELSMLTDPGGFPVRRPYEDLDPTTDNRGTPATTPQEPSAAAPCVARSPGRTGRLTLALVATAGCAAAVGLSAMTFVNRESPARLPDFAEPSSETVVLSPSQKPSRTKPHTRRPPVVPVKSTRPVPSRSATVSTSVAPIKKSPSPKPSHTIRTPRTTTTRTPTPTPPPTPSSEPTTPTPTVSSDPGDTNPPKEET
jgi:serine/threonine protein kinase